MRMRPTTDLKKLARDLRFSLRGLMSGALTESGREDIGDSLEYVFGTRNAFQIAHILAFCSELYALEKGDDEDTA